MTKIETLLEEWKKDPEYEAAFEDLRPEFELASALIAARLQAGLTQAELAERMNTKQSYIAKLESSPQNVTIKTLERIADATGAHLRVSFDANTAKRHTLSHTDLTNMANSQLPQEYSENEATIDIGGCMEGSAYCKCVIVRKNGIIKGDIYADTVKIYGRVEGTIKAHDVYLFSSCHVEGIIMHETLTIEDGALIDGQFKRAERNEPGLSDEDLARLMTTKPLTEKLAQRSSSN